MKHNNALPNQHFRKEWDRYVKTWFNQPAKKVARRSARLAKAKAVAPRPLHLLRPAVRGQTVKYNRKVRAGRGFTLAELRAAGVSPKTARGVGISVDHRRRNKSEEGFQKNVLRLKAYKAKLVVFPRNPTSQRTKKGDATAEDVKQVGAQILGEVLPITQDASRVKPRKITKAEREASGSVAATLRKALTDAKMWGLREKRAKDKAESAKTPKAATETDE